MYGRPVSALTVDALVHLAQLLSAGLPPSSWLRHLKEADIMHLPSPLLVLLRWNDLRKSAGRLKGRPHMVQLPFY